MFFFSYCAAKVIVDRETGRSRGFGFVNFNDETAATAAISEMDGKVCIECSNSVFVYDICFCLLVNLMLLGFEISGPEWSKHSGESC